MTGATRRSRDKKNLAVNEFGLKGQEFNPNSPVDDKDDLTGRRTETDIA
jgi:hypothetical protein